MEEAERGRKKVFQTAISALCLEAGFISVEKKALDALGQLVECCETKCQGLFEESVISY